MVKHSTQAATTALEISPVRALFEGVADSWVVGLSSTERPPRGLAGVLDWHLKGWISRSLEQGVFSGKPGECAYVPLQHQGRTLHLLFAGLGSTIHQRALPASSIKALEKNISDLGRTNWGFSLQDLGEEIGPRMSKVLTGKQGEAKIWISP